MDPFELDPSLATPDEGPIGPPELSVAPVAPVPDVGLLPPTEPLLGAPPRLTVPPPPPPPPSPMQDPKQQLLAIIALGLATGQGVRGGGAGALHGFNETQKALRQDQLSTYQRTVNEQKIQEANARIQFTQQEQDYRQREQRLQTALVNFKTQASKASSKAEYDGLADAYGNSLRAAGYRTISPDWFRANVPYVKPSQQSLAVKAFKAWQDNKNNATFLTQHPDQAAKSVVEVDLNGDGVKERMPLAQLAEAAGQGFAVTEQGIVPVPATTQAGKSEFQMKYQSLVETFKAENRRDPTPKENDKIVDKAIATTKTERVPTTLAIRTVDEQGQPVTKIVPKVAGASYKTAPSATEQRVADQAEAVNQTGNDIIAKLSDPIYASKIGPLLGRFTSLREFIGNPPPEFSELAGMIESYSLANMGVHGMRSAQGAEQIKKMLDAHHTPASLIAAIKGLQGFSQHYLENQGRTVPELPGDAGWVDLGGGVKVRKKR